jgi:polygalacturonase
VITAILWLVSLAGCDSTQAVAPPAVDQPTGPLQDEVDVTDYGARGNDQTDDRAAFAAAINALPAEGGTVRIPAGTYLFTATPRSSIGRGIDLFRRTNVTLAGAGMEQTILRMAPGASYNGDTDVVLIELSSGITMRDLTIDGNRAQVSYVDEQSHGVNLRGSSNVRFERVHFTGMHGDGILMIGYLGSSAWTEQVHIEDCLFSHNGRSGITVQRVVRDVTITGNTFTRIQDQAIDFEPSDLATGDDFAPRNFEITNNRFYETATLSLTITGVGKSQPAQDVRVADNDFEGTGIFVFNAADVRIENNRIRSGHGWAPIEVRKESQRIWIVDNTIDARGTPDKAAILLTFHTSEAPKDVHILNNRIQTDSGNGFSARDSESLQIIGNRLSGSGGVGISVQDINPGTPLAQFVIENNVIEGYEIGVRFVSRGDQTTGVCVRENVFTNVEATYQERGPIENGCVSR